MGAQTARNQLLRLAGMGLLLRMEGAGVSDVPVLTGLTRWNGQTNAHFQSVDGQHSFSLKPGGEWANYRLIEVDFRGRTATMAMDGQTNQIRFGGGLVATSPPPPQRTPPQPKIPVSPFSPDDEAFRARYGREAFTKLQEERLLERLKAEDEARTTGKPVPEELKTVRYSQAVPGM